MDEWQPLLDRLAASRRRVTNEFVRAGGRALLGLREGIYS
jgi:hypothetical protein